MLCFIFLVTAKMSSYINQRQYFSVLLFLYVALIYCFHIQYITCQKIYCNFVWIHYFTCQSYRYLLVPEPLISPNHQGYNKIQRKECLNNSNLADLFHTLIHISSSICRFTGCSEVICGRHGIIQEWVSRSSFQQLTFIMLCIPSKRNTVKAYFSY